MPHQQTATNTNKRHEKNTKTAASFDTLCASLPRSNRCVRISAFDVGPYVKSAGAATHKKGGTSGLPQSCAPFVNGQLHAPAWVPESSVTNYVQPDM